MYSLPITTYSDYWRTTKQWSSYLGGLAVLVAGTRYSTLEPPVIPHMIQLHSLQTIQSISSKQLNTEGIAKQRPLFESIFSRVIHDQGHINLDLASQGAVPEEVSSQDWVSQSMPNEGAADKTTISIQVLDKEIPFETQYVESDKLLPGMSQTQDKGEIGVLRQVVKVFEVDGQPIDQQVLSNYEFKSPKREVIIRNSKPVPKMKVVVQTSKPEDTYTERASVNLSDLNISRTLNVEATAYTYTGNNTATGVKPREGLIAVDPKVIAMGSHVYVEGYGYAIAADTGGAIKGNRIDVFFGTLSQCIDWGRKPVQIHVLKPI